VDKLCSGASLFLFAIDDFIPKSVSQREDHDVNEFFYQLESIFRVVINILSVVTMARPGNKRRETGRQHQKSGVNNNPQKTNPPGPPRSGLLSKSPVKSSCPNLHWWEVLLHKRTLPVGKEELHTAKNEHSFLIAYCKNTINTNNPSNFMPMILKKME
jgi:hypothetical protein